MRSEALVDPFHDVDQLRCRVQVEGADEDAAATWTRYDSRDADVRVDRAFDEPSSEDEPVARPYPIVVEDESNARRRQVVECSVHTVGIDDAFAVDRGQERRS